MENDFRNPSAIVWANLDNQANQAYSRAMPFFKVLINFLYQFLVCGSATICDVTTVQLSNGNCAQFFPPKFYFYRLQYMLYRPYMIVHAFIIELDQRYNIQ